MKLQKIKELKKVANNEDGNYAYHKIEYEEPLLDYVEILAEKYKPISKEDFENGYYISRAKGDFAWRYIQNEFDKSRLKNYLEDEDVQKTIKVFGYDIEKFWYLLLFVNDYSEGACLKGIKRNDSPIEQIDKLLKGITKNLEPLTDNKFDFSFKTPTKIVLEGVKPKIIVDNPTAILWLTHACNEAMKNVHENSEMEHIPISRNINGKIEHNSVSNSQHIWYFAKMFLIFFGLEKPQEEKYLTNSGIISPNKMVFISRLVYLMGLTKNKKYLNSDNNNLKGLKSKYKDEDLGMFNGIYL